MEMKTREWLNNRLDDIKVEVFEFVGNVNVLDKLDDTAFVFVAFSKHLNTMTVCRCQPERWYYSDVLEMAWVSLPEAKEICTELLKYLHAHNNLTKKNSKWGRGYFSDPSYFESIDFDSIFVEIPDDCEDDPLSF